LRDAAYKQTTESTTKTKGIGAWALRVSLTWEVKVTSPSRGEEIRIGGEVVVVPGGEEEDERAGPGAAAEAPAGERGHRLAHEQQRERDAAQRRGRVRAVRAVCKLLPLVRLQPRLRQGEERRRRRRRGQKRKA